MRTHVYRVLILLVSALLLSCADPIPVPADKVNYVGIWVASDRYISIFPNGRLEYRKKLDFGLHNSKAGNFTFVDDTLDMGILGSFHIDEPPFKEGDHWRMQMEGILYVHKGPPKRYGKSNHWPEGID